MVIVLIFGRTFRHGRLPLVRAALFSEVTAPEPPPNLMERQIEPPVAELKDEVWPSLVLDSK